MNYFDETVHTPGKSLIIRDQVLKTDVQLFKLVFEFDLRN